MNFSENYKKRVDKPTYNTNNRNENPGIKRNFDRISAINSPLTEQMLTEINLENNNSNKLEKQFGSLIYKSIFNSLEKKGKKDNQNNKTTDNDININSLQEKENRKNYISHTNKKINKNIKLNINLINSNDINIAKQGNNKNNLYSNKNINTNININNIYNEDNKIKDSQFNIDKNNNYKNYSGGFINNDIKYQKQNSANQDNRININNININNNSSNKNININLNKNENIKNISNFATPQNLKNDKKTLKYQKSEDNLNRYSILDKQEFMKNIKEIDDLEYLDGNNNFTNDKNENDIFSQKELLSNINNDAIFGNGQNKIIKKSNLYIKENKSNNGRNKKKTHFILPTNNNENHLSSFKSPQNSFISTTNNSNINNKNYNKNTHNNNINKNIITNNQNQNNINISIGKEKLYNNNLSNYENNIVDMNKIKLSGMNLSNTNIQNNQNKKMIYDNGIYINPNSFYSHNKNINYKEKYNNFIMSPELNRLNYFATLSNGDIDNSFSNNNNQNNQINQNNIIINNNNNINYKNIDNLIYNKIQNYKNINNNNKSFNKNKSDNLTNEFSKSFGSNNYNTPKNIINNMLDVSYDKKNYIEIKENYEKLKKELANKNNLIEKYTKIIKDYKEKFGILLIKNKKLQEISKSKQIALLEQIKEYQKEIYKLTNDINYYKQNSENNSKIENNNNSNANISDYIRQINELKEELENYKKENNNLKILAILYKNSNINNTNNINNNVNNNTFCQTQLEENLRNRFYSSRGLDKKYNKKSFSATKTKKRIRASSLSKKNFEEGDIDLPSDNNHVNSFMLY